MLVPPGVPKGTPAVIITWLPSIEISSLLAMDVALSTISRKLLASSVSTQWTPQTIAMRRAVSRLGVKTKMGTSGRSLDARRAVEPELV